MAEFAAELQNQLGSKGQRRLIWRILQQANDHLDANAIFERADHYPHLDIAKALMEQE